MTPAMEYAKKTFADMEKFVCVGQEDVTNALAMAYLQGAIDQSNKTNAALAQDNAKGVGDPTR